MILIIDKNNCQDAKNKTNKANTLSVSVLVNLILVEYQNVVANSKRKLYLRKRPRIT